MAILVWLESCTMMETAVSSIVLMEYYRSRAARGRRSNNMANWAFVGGAWALVGCCLWLMMD